MCVSVCVILCVCEERGGEGRAREQGMGKRKEEGQSGKGREAGRAVVVDWMRHAHQKPNL